MTSTTTCPSSASLCLIRSPSDRFGRSSFGFKTLERSYLLRINGAVAERPQHLIMRVAVGIHGRDVEKAIETYNYMSERYFTHASPTVSSSLARPLHDPLMPDPCRSSSSTPARRTRSCRRASSSR